MSYRKIFVVGVFTLLALVGSAAVDVARADWFDVDSNPQGCWFMQEYFGPIGFCL